MVSTYGTRSRRRLWTFGAAAVPIIALAAALGADDFDADPIRYTTTAPRDAIAGLQQKLDRGQTRLAWDAERGYLPSVLQQLGVPRSSQMLVFSKTSFQRDRISPLSPRAIYFNDEVYLGWVQGGSVLEVSTADPQLGAVFYTLEQQPDSAPKFVRQTYECLSCHSSSLTLGVPGHTVRSVYPGRDGLPFLQAGTHVTTHESPLSQRWGGWFVTGTHGEQRHLGNLTFKDPEQTDRPATDAGANLTELKRRFRTSPYLTPHSDIAALMVLEHQTYVQNLITRANYETRKALHFERMLNKDLGRPAGFRSDSTVSRIKSVCEPLVRGLLFCKEAKLTAPVAGTSGFQAEFSKEGPRDGKGRSLRDFDLKQRLFRYPCSYLVYSPAFDGLPELAREYVYRRLGEVLDGNDTSPEFAHLTAPDRTAIREILRDTRPAFGE